MKRSADNIQVKWSVGTVTETFEPAIRKTFEEIQHDFSALIYFLIDVKDPADGVRTIDGEIIHEDAHYDVRDLTSTEDGESSALQLVRKVLNASRFCGAFSVCLVQELLITAVVGLALSGPDK